MQAIAKGRKHTHVRLALTTPCALWVSYYCDEVIRLTCLCVKRISGATFAPIWQPYWSLYKKNGRIQVRGSHSSISSCVVKEQIGWNQSSQSVHCHMCRAFNTSFFYEKTSTLQHNSTTTAPTTATATGTNCSKRANRVRLILTICSNMCRTFNASYVKNI